MQCKLKSAAVTIGRVTLISTQMLGALLGLLLKLSLADEPLLCCDLILELVRTMKHFHLYQWKFIKADKREAHDK